MRFDIRTVEPPPGCFFNADDHTYWRGFEKLLGVSEVLHGAGLVDTIGFSEAVREKGSMIHTASVWLEDGEADWDNLSECGIDGYLRCYESWLARSGFIPVLREQPLFDLTIGVGGTLDRGGYMPSKQGNQPWIIDLKSGVPRPEHELQLSAYDVILPTEYLESPRRLGCLYLDRDGGEAKLIPFKDYSVRNTFRGAVSVVRWKQTHNKGERP